MTASDADSLRSAATTAAAKIGDAATTAKSGDAAKLSGAEGASSRGDASVRSLSRGSLSMVLCEDFGTALCDADDHHEALPQPGEGASVAGAGSCPEESASKRRRSADALPLHGEPAFFRASSPSLLFKSNMPKQITSVSLARHLPIANLLPAMPEEQLATIACASKISPFKCSCSRHPD